jgi:hypothetical protein
VGNNIVQGNFIGVDVTGMHAVPTGIGIAAIARTACNCDGAPYNTIGGTVPDERNVIVTSAVAMALQSSHNVVQGNFIGTDATGVHLPASYLVGGVQLTGDDNQVGGTTGGTPGGLVLGPSRRP